MTTYVVRRLLLVIPGVLVAATLVYFMLRVMPGDVVTTLTAEAGVSEEVKAKLRGELGLTDHVIVQYGRWVSRALRGDLGYSHYQGRPVTAVIRDSIETSLTLALMAMTVSVTVALPLGTVAALTRGGWTDQGIRIATAISLAVPSFWLGILLLLLLSRYLGWSPPVIYGSFTSDPIGTVAEMFVPAFVTGSFSAAILSRLVRSLMLETLREDYVRTARGKGLGEYAVVGRHAARNTLVGILTMSSYHFSYILGGVVVVENVFNIPGLGRQTLTAVFARDYDTVLGIVLVLTLLVFLWNLLIDLAYAIVDPRIRYGRSAEA